MSNTRCSNRVRQYLPQQLSDFDSLVQQVFGPTRGFAQAGHAAASLWEEDGAVHLEVDAPGVQRDDVGLTYDKGVLEVRLTRKSPEGERTRLHDERAYGDFVRRVSLPDTVDPDSIEATLADGVLRVQLQKRPEAQPKQIEIR